MEEYAYLNSDQLTELYHKTNEELTRQFLDRVPWTAQQEKVNRLSAIAKELSKRKEHLTTKDDADARSDHSPQIEKFSD